MTDQGGGTQPPTMGERADPPYVADERTMLDAWLNYHRATLLWKCDRLDSEQLAERSAPPSNLSLIGLVRHMAEVEQSWFRIVLAGEDLPDIYGLEDERDVAFDRATAGTAREDLDVFRGEVQHCRAVAGRFGLDDLAVRRRPQREGGDISLRWIYLHMIEEYARHNGHADLIRERIDGTTGD